MFLMSLGFSIVLTGVWPYLDKLDPTAGKAYMGYVVGANPFAQMIFSPLVGWWSNRLGSIRHPLLATLLVFAIANAVYSSLELFPDGRKYWMLASRFLVGVSSANVAALRSYISAATRMSERRKAISMLSLVQVLGFIVGPAIQAAVVPFGNDGFWIIPNHLKMSMYTATGWLNVLLALGNFCLFLPSVFHERKIAEREAALKQAGSNSSKAQSPVPKFAAWSLMIFHFVLVFNFMIMETLGSSVAMDQFAFTKAQAISFMGVMMSVGAGLSCICFIIIHPLCRRLGEMNVMICGGFLLMSIGRFIYIPMSPTTPIIFNETYRLDVLNNLTICKNGIKAYPHAWNVNSTHLEDTTFLNNLCNYTEIVGCPNSQEWCLTTNAILLPQFHHQQRNWNCRISIRINIITNPIFEDIRLKTSGCLDGVYDWLWVPLKSFGTCANDVHLHEIWSKLDFWCNCRHVILFNNLSVGLFVPFCFTRFGVERPT